MGCRRVEGIDLGEHLRGFVHVAHGMEALFKVAPAFVSSKSRRVTEWNQAHALPFQCAHSLRLRSPPSAMGR
ncbi:MAG: hypothetical protein IPI67_07780 [Myxococcales bacterium]|nr:hypothetical protein [Myxococcales bacterium]